MQSTRYSCQVLIKLAFPLQIFKRSFYIKFHEMPCSGSRVVPCGQRRTDGRPDRHDEANSRLTQPVDSRPDSEIV